MSLLDLSFEDAVQTHERIWNKGSWADIAEAGRQDRFFLLTQLLHRVDAVHPWIYERCREVEREPDDHLDLWAREHYKSTVITYAGCIQEILRDPEITIGIFSNNRPTAKKFLNQIKHEFEGNEDLKTAYPEIFHANPKAESPRWSEDRGIIVKRKSNPKEATVEAHGLVEGMPTGAHFRLRVYDDVVTETSVTTPEMLAKTLDAWRLSQNLGTEGGRKWYIGTRYHFSDTYSTMLKEGSAIPRLYPATDDGTPTGNPILIAEKSLVDKRRDMGPYIFACQMLQNPVADEAQGFKREWIAHYPPKNPEDLREGMNVYILCDPANEKKKHSDYSAYFVVGLNEDRSYYVLDMVRDRLNLTERWAVLERLHRKYKPVGVGYEKYGKDSDIQYFEEKMSQINYRFHITALGGQAKKEDRIRRLIPVFEQERMWLPEVLYYDDREGKRRDLVQDFIEQEYLGFPVAAHDDMLDCLSRIRDPEFPTTWPIGADVEPKRDRYQTAPQYQTTWMAI